MHISTLVYAVALQISFTIALSWNLFQYYFLLILCCLVNSNISFFRASLVGSLPDLLCCIIFFLTSPLFSATFFVYSSLNLLDLHILLLRQQLLSIFTIFLVKDSVAWSRSFFSLSFFSCSLYFLHTFIFFLFSVSFSLNSSNRSHISLSSTFSYFSPTLNTIEWWFY